MRTSDLRARIARSNKNRLLATRSVGELNELGGGRGVWVIWVIRARSNGVVYITSFGSSKLRPSRKS